MRVTAIGTMLPVIIPVALVKSNENDWSMAMHMSGQVLCHYAE